MFGSHCNIQFSKIRMRVDIFETEKCKVTFGLEYILNAGYCVVITDGAIYSQVH